MPTAQKVAVWPLLGHKVVGVAVVVDNAAIQRWHMLAVAAESSSVRR